MNDLPQYFRDDHCPGVMLGGHSLNCLNACWWFVSLKSLSVIKSRQKNGNSRWIPKNQNFQHGSETLPIVEKQTYLGIQMTSSGRYTYARDILAKKLIKFLRQWNDCSPIRIRPQLQLRINFLMPLSNLYYFMDAKYGDRSYYHIRPTLTKAPLNKSA